MKNKAFVYGAGIAGLTAAHELAERGFAVTVVEPRRDPREPNSPLVGGLAATQYRRWPAPLGTVRRIPGNEAFVQAPPIVDFHCVSAKMTGRWPWIAPDERVAAVPKVAELLAAMFANSPRSSQGIRHEEVWVFASTLESAVTFRDAVCAQLGPKTLAGCTDALPTPTAACRCLHAPSASTSPYADGQRGKFDQLHVNAGELDGLEHYVVVYIREQLLAGEHGYRFFPSFYRNLFDTLRRIPFIESEPAERFETAALEVHAEVTYERARAHRVTGQTVYDRLVSLTRHAIAAADERPPLELPRGNEGSITAATSLLDDVMSRTKLTMSDLAQSQATLLRYATTSAARRAEYEHLSWSDFSRGRSTSEAFRRAMRHWPRALVGLASDRADARSFGSVQLQLVLDQMRSEGLRDGSLDAPTSEAWLDPWKRYLHDHLGVVFRVGRLTSAKVESGELTIAARGLVEPNADDVYSVVALDLPALIDRGLQIETDEENGPLARVVELRGEGSARSSTFADFVGIQFFLEEDHHVLRGHLYYPDSPWALTSVSPMMYRRDRPDARTRAAGLVSVVIGDLDALDAGLTANGACLETSEPKRARECGPDELAKRVWAQIRNALMHAETPPPDAPLAYHIDERFCWREEQWKNETPFLVNDVALSDWWPEEPGHYRVHHGRLAFAGTWLATKTRLVTMEAACESGRNAANAILSDYAARSDNAAFAMAPTFDIEELEPRDLDWLKRLDAELYVRGVPHVLDVLGGDSLLDRLDPRGDLGRQLLEMARDHGELGSTVGDALRSALTRLVPEALRRTR